MPQSTADSTTGREGYRWSAPDTALSYEPNDVSWPPATREGSRYVMLATLAVTAATTWATGTYQASPTAIAKEADLQDPLSVSAFNNERASHQSAVGDTHSIDSPEIGRTNLLVELDAVHGMPANWDGHDGIGPSEMAISDAKAFLANMPRHWPLPRIGVSGDGEIGFFWDYGQGFIDIGFLGDGHYVFYARDSEGHEAFGDHAPIGHRFDPSLTDILENYS